MQIAHLVQVVVMGVRKLVRLDAMARVKRRGVWWELDLREGIDFSIWLLGSFEPSTVRCYEGIIKAGDTVLDIGANIGAHSLLLAKFAGPRGQVIAFEPTDYAYAKLTRNFSLNPELAARAQCLQYMLVDSEISDATAPSLYSSWPLKAEPGVHQLHQGRLMTTAGARLRTLDSVLSSLRVDRVDCIKLDIDGAECAMLRGAHETLLRWHPPIIMELAPYVLEERGASLGELIQQLKACGYVLFDASSGKSIEMDVGRLQDLIPLGASLNVVARPPEGATK